MNINRNIWNNLMKYFAGDLSDAEREKTELWVNSSSANKKVFEEVKMIFDSCEIAETSTKYNVDEAWSKFDQWMQAEKTSQRQYKIRQLTYSVLKYAAVVILAVSIGFGISNFISEKQEIAEITFNVPKGHRSDVVLQDGTKVMLNSGSEMRVVYNHASERRVILSGEAWFDVAHDSQKPFFVDTERFSVEVIGTAFNIKSYPEDALNHFYLSEGSVQLRNFKGDNLLLNPGQYVAISSDESFTLKTSPGEQTLLSWKEGRYYFRMEPLSEIAKLIERAYGLEVEFATPEIAMEKYTGSLSVDDHVSDLIKKLVLTSGFPMEYTIEDRKIILSSQ
ncbi:MAG: DUF4974 domain-containing protein [Bacteroidetes bacterium]|nr:MAG: DUF4974 domain-containing protein [Bacteroidota bacterium]